MKVSLIVKRIWSIVGITFLLCFAIFFVYGYIFNEPKAALVQKALEQEFKVIRPLPQAVACNYHASHKTQHSLVGSSYSTKLSFPEIRTYYDSELSSHGWHFQREEPLRDWGRDFGGKSVHFCKGDYEASLEYAGEDAGYGWNYALEISWGLDSLYNRWKGNLCQ